MDKFIIRSEDLKEVCSKILTAVDSTELSLVTETLELFAIGDVLTVSVTNREYYAEVNFKLEDVQAFHATVNAMLFLKLVSQITTDTITLSVEDNALIVKGNGTYKLPLIFDGDNLLSLPKIEIENPTATFPVSADTLNSILKFNSKELTKGTISKPVQKLYYMDELGAITFTSGACVNSFSLPQPIKVLLNGRLVKLFKLFKEGNVEFTLGYDAISDDIIQTKVRFSNGEVTITAILSCDDTLINSVPVKSIRGRANNDYPYSINISKAALLQTINRLTLFNNTENAFVKPYGTFEFGSESVTVYDSKHENCEEIDYTNETSKVDGVYEAVFNLSDLKTTLETCVEPYLCMSFGDGSAMVISRGNVKNVLPEVKLV
jgi:hypothetical protein